MDISGVPPLFHNESGLVDVNIKEIPLGAILDCLKAEFGIQVNLHDPSIVSSRVSVRLMQKPLEEVIEAILKPVSYLLHREKNRFELIVLTGDYVQTGKQEGDTSKPELTAMLSKSTEDGKAVDVSTDSKSTQGPKSLDEFQPITLEQFLPDQPSLEGQDAADQSAAAQRYEEALLDRALAAIGSEYKQLHDDAIEQLVGLNDHRATEVLVEATRATTDSDARIQAVERLRMHAENLQLRDENSIDALKQLAEDADPKVSQIARQTLQGIQ